MNESVIPPLPTVIASAYWLDFAKVKVDFE